MAVGDIPLQISAILVAGTLFSHLQHSRTSHFLKNSQSLLLLHIKQWLKLLVGRFLPAEELHLIPFNPQLHLGLPPLKARFQMKIEDLNSSLFLQKDK